MFRMPIVSLTFNVTVRLEVILLMRLAVSPELAGTPALHLVLSLQFAVPLELKVQLLVTEAAT